MALYGYGMDVPNGSGFEKLSYCYSDFRKWLVGWLVNLVKWAKIAISVLNWLKFGMDDSNGP